MTLWDAEAPAVLARMSWVAPWPCPCTAGWCWLTERVGAATTWAPSSASQPPLSRPLLSSLRLYRRLLCALQCWRPWWAAAPPSRVRWEGFFPGGARGWEADSSQAGAWLGRILPRRGDWGNDWEMDVSSVGKYSVPNVELDDNKNNTE